MKLQENKSEKYSRVAELRFILGLERNNKDVHCCLAVCLEVRERLGNDF